MLVAGVIRGMNVTGPNDEWPVGTEFLQPIWDGEKNEIKYARTKRGIDFEHQGKIQVYVALKDIEGVIPAPAPAVLDATLIECKRIVAAIEAEGNRINAFG